MSVLFRALPRVSTAFQRQSTAFAPVLPDWPGRRKSMDCGTAPEREVRGGSATPPPLGGPYGSVPMAQGVGLGSDAAGALVARVEVGLGVNVRQQAGRRGTAGHAGLPVRTVAAGGRRGGGGVAGVELRPIPGARLGEQARVDLPGAVAP